MTLLQVTEHVKEQNGFAIHQLSMNDRGGMQGRNDMSHRAIRKGAVQCRI